MAAAFALSNSTAEKSGYAEILAFNAVITRLHRESISSVESAARKIP